MARSEIKPFDFVWAKLRGYPFWPAQVMQPPRKRPFGKRRQQYVYFYGTHNFAWVLEDNIFPYKEYAHVYLHKGHTPSFRTAVGEIEYFYRNRAQHANGAADPSAGSSRMAFIRQEAHKKIACSTVAECAENIGTSSTKQFHEDSCKNVTDVSSKSYQYVLPNFAACELKIYVRALGNKCSVSLKVFKSGIKSAENQRMSHLVFHFSLQHDVKGLCPEFEYWEVKKQQSDEMPVPEFTFEDEFFLSEEPKTVLLMSSDSESDVDSDDSVSSSCGDDPLFKCDDDDFSKLSDTKVIIASGLKEDNNLLKSLKHNIKEEHLLVSNQLCDNNFSVQAIEATFPEKFMASPTVERSEQSSTDIQGGESENPKPSSSGDEKKTANCQLIKLASPISDYVEMFFKNQFQRTDSAVKITEIVHHEEVVSTSNSDGTHIVKLPEFNDVLKTLHLDEPKELCNNEFETNDELPNVCNENPLLPNNFTSYEDDNGTLQEGESSVQDVEYSEHEQRS